MIGLQVCSISCLNVFTSDMAFVYLCSIIGADVQVRLTQDGNYTIDDGANAPKP